MKKNLKITDTPSLSEIFGTASQKIADDDSIVEEGPVEVIDTLYDDEPAESNEDMKNNDANAETAVELKVSIKNDDFDEDEIRAIAEDNGCKLAEFNDSTIIFEGTSDNLTKVLSDDIFELDADTIADLIISANDEVADKKSSEPAASEKVEAEPATSMDSLFSDEEINLLKQLVSIAPDLIALVEKANDQEEAEEKSEDPGEELDAGDNDEDDEDDEDDSQSTTGEMIAEFGDSDDEVGDPVITHDSKAAFGSIERHNTVVTDSIDEDLDVIALWNKRYGG